jgi:hypothetical protein
VLFNCIISRNDTSIWEHLDVPVFEAHAVVDVGAVVVEHDDAAVTHAAMLAADRLHCAARVAQTAEGISAVLPLLKVHHLQPHAILYPSYIPVLELYTCSILYVCYIYMLYIVCVLNIHALYNECPVCIRG